MLTAAMVLARLVVTDGKYEKWQELFFKQLVAASDHSWEDRDWSALGNDHALTFFHGKTRTSVILRFTTTMNGNYDFAYAFTQQGSGKPVRIALAKGVPGKAPVIETGKDLLAQILSALGLENQGPASVAASVLKAAVATPMQAASAKDSKAIEDFMKAAAKGLKGGAVTRPVTSEGGKKVSLGFPLGNAQVESTWRQADGDFELVQLAVNGGSARKYLRLDASSIGDQSAFNKAISTAVAAAKWYDAGSSSPVLNLK
jgi:hypothetical protein